jgi:hypothetical protein
MKRKRLEEVMQEIFDMREKMISNLNKEKELLEQKFYSELNKKLPHILLQVSKKVFGNKELNEDFIKKMLG